MSCVFSLRMTLKHLSCCQKEHCDVRMFTTHCLMFLHRTLWDLQIPHEYRLVRWGDHVGVSMADRLMNVMGFVGASLRGGRAEPRDIPLNEAERAYLEKKKLKLEQL